MSRFITGGYVRPRRTVTVAVLLTLGLATAACAGDDSEPDDAAVSPGAPAGTPTQPADDQPAPVGDALYFYPPVEGATLTFVNGGLGDGTTEVTVDSVTSGADGETVSITEVLPGEGDSVTVERVFHTAGDGSLRIDAAAFAALGQDTEVTATGDDILIPAISDLEAGDTSTGETFVEIAGAGFEARIDVAYTVSGVGHTSVTVPAGTVDVYQLEIALVIDNTLAGSAEGLGQYWFAPGFGLVQQEMRIAGNTITAELVDSSVPLP